MNHATKRLLTLPLLLSCAALAGCGPRYGKRVPNPLLEQLPYESRIELLESENDLALAIDQLDEARAEVSRTRDGIRRAKDRRSAAEDEEDKATDASSKQVAQLAVEEAEARVEYLRARQVINLAQESIKELALQCAKARFERSRLAVANKAKVKGAEALRVDEFEAQVKDCDAEVAERTKALKEDSDKAESTRTAWEQKKDALAKKTFDARASPYVE